MHSLIYITMKRITYKRVKPKKINNSSSLKKNSAQKREPMYSNQSTYSDISIAIDICGCYQKISISYKKVNETFSEAYPNL